MLALKTPRLLMALTRHYQLSFCFFILSYVTMTNQEPTCPFNSIYQLGDSTSDTGNLISVPVVGPMLPSALPPFGQTFPGRPTGRWSDGRLIIDYIAMNLGLPLLNPFLGQDKSFENGVNFAVAGATALNISFLATRGIIVPFIVTPLSGQLYWFQQYLKSLCSTPTECSNKLDKALIVLGDIGNNDIDYALSQSRTPQQIMDYVLPFIPQEIANAIREIVRLGANKIIVPGTFPLGCLPINLVLFPNDAKDEHGCLISINNLSIYFNNILKETLIPLMLEFPHAKIIYADYYNAFEYIHHNGPTLGFDGKSLLKACCGIGGSHNYDRYRFCGSLGVPACNNPTSYIHWDGYHFTQEAHRRIAEYLIPDIFANFNCSS